jgi:membrane protease YdiL (CAAX protease family)
MPDSRLKSILRRVFRGPDGIRAGWRLLIYLSLTYVLAEAISALLDHIPLAARILSAHVRGIVTPQFSIVIGIPVLLAFPLSALIMAKIERRPFGTYGLPLIGAYGKLFWQGVIWGLVAMSVVMVAIYTLGGFSFGAFALSGLAVIKYGLLWAFSALLVGLAEEFQFHGYTLFTATTGIGFWPSALVLSAVFGLGHLENLDESWPGILQVFVFSLLCCFTLRRTGTLWFAIGLHTAWDFAEDFLFSVSDSGLRSTGTLLNSAVHGPRWLTGGAVGPEGSVFTFICWGLSFLVFSKLYPVKTNSPVPSGTTLPEARAHL